MAKKKSYIAAARRAGAVYKSGAKKGRIMSAAQAARRGIHVPGFSKKKITRKKATRRKPASRKAPRAPKKSAMAQRYRTRRSRAGKQPYSRTGYKKGRRLTWLEAAHQSGAVYPATYPRGHKSAGKRHPKAGRAMTKQDALKHQRPVVGYLSRGMIQGFYGQILTAGGRLTSSKAKIREAYAWLSDQNDSLRSLRKARGSAWLRAPQSYTRSGKTPGGKKYKKGARRPDYRQSWSATPARFQSGGGQHLRVKFRRGRGPVVRVPVYRGIGPSEREVALLEAGGFGGPLLAPGGVVKLNKRRRRKTSRRRKARRNKSQRSKRTGRFLKKKSTGRRRGRRKKIKAYNNPHRRRKRRKRRRARVRSNPYHRRRRRRTRAASNPRKRRRRRRKRRVRRNAGHTRYRRKARKGRRRKRRVRRNWGYRKNQPLKAALAQLQSRQFWTTVVQVGVGMTGTALIASALMGLGPLRRLSYGQGWGGKLGRFAICLGSAGLLSAGAYMLRGVRLVGSRGWINVLVGGTVYCTANLLSEIFLRSTLIPRIGIPGARRMGDDVGVGGYYDPLLPSGSYPGQYPGMGMVMSPEELVAGESLARNVNEFSGMDDWLELSGLGQGGTPIPLEDLRGYPGQYGGGMNGGMNDWIEFNESAGLVQAGFNPGAETF